jgi:hypothetical protein
MQCIQLSQYYSTLHAINKRTVTRPKPEFKAPLYEKKGCLNHYIYYDQNLVVVQVCNRLARHLLVDE